MFLVFKNLEEGISIPKNQGNDDKGDYDDNPARDILFSENCINFILRYKYKQKI